MQPHQLGEAYKSRDTTVDLQTVDKELWGRQWDLSLSSAKVDCAAWRTALETWGKKVRRSSKTTPRRVRDVTLAIEGRGGGGRVRPDRPRLPETMSSTDFEALGL